MKEVPGTRRTKLNERAHGSKVPFESACPKCEQLRVNLDMTAIP